jgi:hypothetical protein
MWTTRCVAGALQPTGAWCEVARVTEGQHRLIGSPLALDYPTPSGQLQADFERGQFKVEPGRDSFGVLSLQSVAALEIRPQLAGQRG